MGVTGEAGGIRGVGECAKVSLAVSLGVRATLPVRVTSDTVWRDDALNLMDWHVYLQPAFCKNDGYASSSYLNQLSWLKSIIIMAGMKRGWVRFL